MGTAYGHASVQNLAQCVGTLPDAPDLVQETAQDWIRHGGGRDAHECLAQADLALGAYREAAQEYDSLASVAAADRGRESANGHSEKNSSQTFAEQAAGAWLLAGDGKAAESAARQALTYDPARLGLRVLLSRSLAMQGNFQGSITALGSLTRQAQSAAPVDSFLVQALVVRANAYRQLGQNEKGLEDVNRALSLQNEDVDALLERGILEARLTRYAQARQDWDRVIALSPDGQAAYLARQDEAVLDADPDQN
ncbi:hypothetical protein JCM15831A_28010 [Asaia astilbis]